MNQNNYKNEEHIHCKVLERMREPNLRSFQGVDTAFCTPYDWAPIP